MAGALVATAAMSAGAVAGTVGAHPLVPFLAFAAALLVLLARPSLPAPSSALAGRALVALATIAVVADRRLFVSSGGLAPDDVLALLVVVGAFVLPRGRHWAAVGLGVVLATYAVTSATLLAAKPYHSDAVVSAHGAADLLLQGRHPYASFDLIAQLERFGLPPEYSTALEDGTRVRSLQYPALAFLLPAPLLAAGLADVRALYLFEVLVIFGLVIAATPPGIRALALAACVGNLVILDQFVLAGVDPLWALLLVAAWLMRRHTASAALLGLAVADRQQAWLIAPFLVLWAWRALGAREAARRAALAAAVALALHAPFLWSDPAAVAGGLLDSALQPHEPWGIGPTKLLADLGWGGAVPRQAYLAAAGGAYLLALAAYATRRRDDALVLPLLPLWFGWRALQSYFAFSPLFALTEQDRYDRADALGQGAPRDPRVPRRPRPGA